MKLTAIDSGRFKLDGGAMFGVVPKTLWQKLNPPDDNNLCTWAMRCLLVEDGERKILIDTGIGTKQDERFMSHFHPHGDHNLISSIQDSEISVEEITDVLITHFHFDHVGGAVSKDSKGRLYPTFPNATYWTNKPHYDWAYNPNSREQASFLKENFVPLKEQGILKYIDVEQDVNFTDNIRIQFYDGHTEKMMVPFIDLPNGKTVVYAADLLPSSGHIKVPYVMAYDVRPLVTIQEKILLYEQITNANHCVFFEHDKDHECGTIIQNKKGRYEVINRGPLLSNLT